MKMKIGMNFIWLGVALVVAWFFSLWGIVVGFVFGYYKQNILVSIISSIVIQVLVLIYTSLTNVGSGINALLCYINPFCNPIVSILFGLPIAIAFGAIGGGLGWFLGMRSSEMKFKRRKI